jgi:hypothetical protein
LQGFQVGGDEGYVRQLMDRMVEEGFICNGSITAAGQSDPIYTRTFSPSGGRSSVNSPKRRAVIVPNCEKLVFQLSSRRKLYDSKGRERLESKADLASRGVESPDRADALIGGVMMGIGLDPYALNPRARQAMREMMDQTIRRMKRNRSRFAVEHVNWELM